jgi:hypothetical protein
VRIEFSLEFGICDREGREGEGKVVSMEIINSKASSMRADGSSSDRYGPWQLPTFSDIRCAVQTWGSRCLLSRDFCGAAILARITKYPLDTLRRAVLRLAK